MDVKSTFLHGDPTGEIYEGRQSCFPIEKTRIWFEMGPQAWYYKNDCFFINLNFKQCELHQNTYFLHVNNETLIVKLSR